jgi:hypothetical protein
MRVPALLFVGRWGRRPTLVIGAVSMMVWWFMTAGLLASYGHHAPPGSLNGIVEESWLISGAASKAVIASSYLIVSSYAPTWGLVSWIYLLELFLLRLCAKGVALSTSAVGCSILLWVTSPLQLSPISHGKRTSVSYGHLCT